MKLLDELPAIGAEIRIKCHNNNNYVRGIIISVMGDYLQLEVRKGVFSYIYKNNILDYGHHIWPKQGETWSDE